MYQRPLQFATGASLVIVFAIALTRINLFTITRPWIPGTAPYVAHTRGENSTDIEVHMNEFGPKYVPGYNFATREARREARRSREFVSELPAHFPPPQHTVYSPAILGAILKRECRETHISGTHDAYPAELYQQVVETLGLGTLAEVYELDPADILYYEATLRFSDKPAKEGVAEVEALYRLARYIHELGYTDKHLFSGVTKHFSDPYRPAGTN